MRHKQVIATLMEFSLVEFEENDSPINALDNKTIRQSIMKLETKKKDNTFAAIERS